MHYFPKAGPQNTADTVRLVKDAAAQYGVDKLVVASKDGVSALQFLDSGLDVLCVTHQYGFSEPGAAPIEESTRQKLLLGGQQILTATHGMAGVDRALRFRFGGVYPSEVVAETLRIFGQGVKVAVEVASMAADHGFVRPGDSIIAVGGSGSGLDTALLISPQHIHNIFDTKILRFICLPAGPVKEG